MRRTGTFRRLPSPGVTFGSEPVMCRRMRERGRAEIANGNRRGQRGTPTGLAEPDPMGQTVPRRRRARGWRGEKPFPSNDCQLTFSRKTIYSLQDCARRRMRGHLLGIPHAKATCSVLKNEKRGTLDQSSFLLKSTCRNHQGQGMLPAKNHTPRSSLRRHRAPWLCLVPIS